MAYQLLNTLYVQNPDAYVRLDHETLRVEVSQQLLLQVPIHHLGGVILMGGAAMSPHAMHRCVEDEREVTFLDFAGRFLCRVVGPVSGNVLLRLAQYDAYRDGGRCLGIARRFVGAKLRNSRQTLVRGAREAPSSEAKRDLAAAAGHLEASLARVPAAGTLDDLRGIEGEAAAWYYAVFAHLLLVPAAEFAFAGRSRRPPRDRVNALLSFLYTVLTHDCVGALEGVGLDPQVGFLHAVRPGRPSLALDLAEEYRSGLVDRLALALINRRQLRPDHFEAREGAGESVLLNEEGRKVVITAYQKRKQETVHHRQARQPVPLGLTPHVQARLLARHLRGDTERYPPFLFDVHAPEPRGRREG